MASTTQWPPALTTEQESHLLELATDYALGSGLVYRPPALTADSIPSTTSAIHAPYSLFPTPFPRHLFQQAQQLQPLYNALYAHVTTDHPFLDQVVGGAVAKVDEFQGKLYELWKQVEQEGVKQVSLTLSPAR
jgi:glutathione synthase